MQPFSINSYLSDLCKSNVSSNDEQQLSPLQHSCLDALKHVGLPTRKTPGWQFLKMKSFFDQQYSSPTVLRQAIPEWVAADNREKYSVVMVDGVYSDALSNLPAHVDLRSFDFNVVQSSAEFKTWKSYLCTLPRYEIMSKLGLFLAGRAFSLDVGQIDKKTTLNVYRYYTQEHDCLYTEHASIKISAGANVHLVEHPPVFSKSARSISQCVLRNTVIQQGVGGMLQHDVLGDIFSTQSFFDHVVVSCSRDACYGRNALVSGDGIYRAYIQVNLCDQGAQSHVYGLAAPFQSGQLDTSLQVNHHAKNGTSRQTIKSVVSDQALSGFCGRVFVAKDAQQTDAGQISRGLLLSSRAQAVTKPELEIYADDVKCAHGATVGHIDQDALFYLRSRGLNDSSAKKLLVEGFLQSMIVCFNDVCLRDLAQSLLSRFLQSL
ncbi:MAG: SufD family Fe-S cluster assembly protein [Pseudomonadota bacterium]|nr:SufD family Fe-S cluster assembly protein [Pseudomonadota bacterium]